jgi:ribose transport system ATP-binding protein
MANAELREIIHLMVGRDLEDIYPSVPHEIGEPILEIKHLAGSRRPEDASFVLRKGEILGVAGLMGAGRTETLRVAFGLDSMEGGEVLSHGKRFRPSPARAMARGLGMLSENRKEEGLMLNLSLAENLTLPHLSPFTTGGLLDTAAQTDRTAHWMRQLKVRARNASQPIGELSGGNQQKIAIGRLLHSESEVLLLDEPTRGIDVASKAQIYELIGELAAQGKAIVFVSSYLPELLGVCDTIAVMCRGRITDVRPVSEWTEHIIITAAIGQAC